MQRNAVDPASFRVGRQHRGLTLGIQRDQLAVVTARNDACAIRRRAEDRAEMHFNLRDFANRSSDDNLLLSADETCVVAEEIHRRYGRTQRQRPHLVGHRSDGAGFTGIELFHHVTMQRSKPSRIICSGSSRPMKTTRLSRRSPSFHFRWWSPSSIMCTPWKT